MSTEREYEAGTDLDPEAEAYVESAPATKVAPVDDDDDPPAPKRERKVEPDYDPSAKAEAATPDPDEERAARMGWSPKEQWRGAPEKWVDAKTFVERANPAILLERMDKIAKEHEATIARLEKMNQRALEKQTKDYEERIASLKKQRDREVIQVAKDSGAEVAEEHAENWDKYIAAQKPPAPEPTQPQARPPEAEAWVQKRPQYNSDPVFQSAAYNMMGQIHQEMADKPLSAQMEELDRRLAATGRFPDIYAPPTSKPTANGAPPPESRSMDGVRISGKKSTNYAGRMNAAERAQAKRFVAQGLFKNEEEYAKDLYNDE